MSQLTSQWQQKVNDLASQYNVSSDAVLNLLQAVHNGNGTMAQFYHPELGGGGQWMQGGMTMVGDMFNNGLKYTVDGLCMELSQFMLNQPQIYVQPSHQSPKGSQQQQQGGYGNFNTGNWWPSELGAPTMTGGQNNMRYAYFADMRRLAMDINGQITVFDTLDHQIGGVSQQQGSNLSITFSSQLGTVDPFRLPIVSSNQNTASNTTEQSLPEPEPQAETAPVQENFQPQTDVNSPVSAQESDIFATLEKLEHLRQKGILTEEEFLAKKNELLSRL
jgi:hypothetical protein